MDVDEPDLLIQFINRPDTDPEYIADDETFMAKCEVNKIEFGMFPAVYVHIIAKEYIQQELCLVNVRLNG